MSVIIQEFHLSVFHDVESVVQHYAYSSFGKILSIKDGNGNDVTDAPPIKNQFTYTGREWDDESGLYYYRARYYSPEIGRFLSIDPDAGRKVNPLTAINRYAYSLNDSINRVDPNGTFSFKKAIAIGLGVINPLAALTYINIDDGVFSEKDTRRITNAAITISVVAAAAYVSPGIAAGVLAGTAFSRKDKGNPFDDLHFAGEFALSFGITYGASLLFPGGNDPYFGKQANEGVFTTANRTFVNSAGLTVGMSSFQSGLSSEERSERRGIGLFLLGLGFFAPN